MACFLPIVQQRISFVGDWSVFGGWLETEVGAIILVLPTKLPKRAGNTAGSGSVLGLFVTHKVCPLFVARMYKWPYLPPSREAL